MNRRKFLASLASVVAAGVFMGGRRPAPAKPKPPSDDERFWRSHLQVEAMEAAMIIRRLERVPLRYKHLIDAGDIADPNHLVGKYLRTYRAA